MFELRTLPAGGVHLDDQGAAQIPVIKIRRAWILSGVRKYPLHA